MLIRSPFSLGIRTFSWYEDYRADSTNPTLSFRPRAFLHTFFCCGIPQTVCSHGSLGGQVSKYSLGSGGTEMPEVVFCYANHLPPLATLSVKRCHQQHINPTNPQSHHLPSTLPPQPFPHHAHPNTPPLSSSLFLFLPIYLSPQSRHLQPRSSIIVNPLPNQISSTPPSIISPPHK